MGFINGCSVLSRSVSGCGKRLTTLCRTVHLCATGLYAILLASFSILNAYTMYLLVWGVELLQAKTSGNCSLAPTQPDHFFSGLCTTCFSLAWWGYFRSPGHPPMKAAPEPEGPTPPPLPPASSLSDQRFACVAYHPPGRCCFLIHVLRCCSPLLRQNSQGEPKNGLDWDVGGVNKVDDC